MKARTNGFTLIELMIVVGIIGTLAAIAIPTFTEYMAKTKHGEGLANLGAMYKGLSAYYEREHVSQGLTGTAATHCLPGAAFGGAAPLPVLKGWTKAVGDFTGSATWDALAFTPAEPVYHTYYFWNPTGGSTCGVVSNPDKGSITASNDPDADGDLYVVTMEWDVFDGRLIRAPFFQQGDNIANPWP